VDVEQYLQTGVVAVGSIFLRVGYKHIMSAFLQMRRRDDALAKRIVGYEKTNNDQHTAILERLSHVEALVNGKGS